MRGENGTPIKYKDSSRLKLIFCTTTGRKNTTFLVLKLTDFADYDFHSILD